MQNFRFSLDMSWRHAELHREEQGLAPLVAELGQLDGASNRNSAARERFETGRAEAHSVYGSELGARAAYGARLEKKIIAIELQHVKCQDLIAAQRVRVVDAHRRLRLLEKLRAHQRQFKAWRAGWQREENASCTLTIHRMEWEAGGNPDCRRRRSDCETHSALF